MTVQKLFAGDDSTGDNHLLDFRCPFIQRNNPGITVHSFDGIVFHIAVAAMDLKGFIGDIYCGLGGIIFGHGGFFSDRHTGIMKPCSIDCQLQGSFCAGCHICQIPLDSLVGIDWLAKLCTLTGISNSSVNSPLT